MSRNGSNLRAWAAAKPSNLLLKFLNQFFEPYQYDLLATDRFNKSPLFAYENLAASYGEAKARPRGVGLVLGV